jgi:hypothetical protein
MPKRSRPKKAPQPTVHVEHRQGGTVVNETQSSPVQPEPGPGEARVYVEGSVTHNMGDYNSVRVAVGVSFPCPATNMAVDETYEYLSGKVDELLESELALATGEDPDAEV